GNFTTAGGSAANRMAKWNGSGWSALGSGLDEQVNELAVSGGDVYAGGWFTTAGGSAANRVGKWNGSSWSAVGSGIGSCGGWWGRGLPFGLAAAPPSSPRLQSQAATCMRRAISRWRGESRSLTLPDGMGAVGRRWAR